MTRLGRTARSWLLVLGALALLVAVLGLTGGLSSARPAAPDSEPGEWMETTRWRVQVQQCTVTPSDPARLQITLQVENTWHATQRSVNWQAMRLALPNGEVYGQGGEYFTIDDEFRTGGFEPGIVRPAVINLWLSEPIWSGDQDIRLVLATEALAEPGPVDIGEYWLPTGVAAVIELPCPIQEAP